MVSRPVYIGNTHLKIPESEVAGEFVNLEEDRFYKISNYDRMPDFFMSIVSASDHWMFISSNGSLTAGRKNSGYSLFPYYTDDKIHDYQGITGSRSIFLVAMDGKTFLWEPFAAFTGPVYSVRRNIYKNSIGNKLIFEEINDDLHLTFRYGWFNSNRFGFIRKSVIINHKPEEVYMEVLDGIQNILPYGVDNALQSGYSTLVDGYKRNELLPETGIGIYRLSSIPTDKAEPSEALKVNIVWSEGLEESKRILSTQQVERFIQGQPVAEETDIRAMKGAYFIVAEITLAGNTRKEWNIIADVDKDTSDLVRLSNMLTPGKQTRKELAADINRGTEELLKIIANADGLQCSLDELSTSKHMTNVLFNVMRGGIFDNNYMVRVDDFLSFVKQANTSVSNRKTDFVRSLGESIHYAKLLIRTGQQNDADLLRICYEYLPLTFSRRHGDPSRPWNYFSIDTRKEDGSKILNYQGNWRDIFQNWEALSLSFPEFTESMICKFVNASTADGYNPYRITRNGFDWEIPDPSDPWSNIGYWGDHQIIYLLRLLDISKNHHPEQLGKFLREEIFTYANIPYRIKPYEDLISDPHNTIAFDAELNRRLQDRVSSAGADGRLIWDQKDQVYHVNLAEKLLVPVLAKLSNLIPEGGIWLNTQRPEWNDANNALVGYGVSMVTVYYLREYLTFCRDLFSSAGSGTIPVSREVAGLLKGISGILHNYQHVLQTGFSDIEKKSLLDKLGRAGSEYRQIIYGSGFSGKEQVKITDITEFIEWSLKYTDHTIKTNKRDDRLYHSYNLMKVEGGNKISLRYLYEMLEGQVAAISSGYLSEEEVVGVLDALKKSNLFREDQYSYILYPNRKLPVFTEKNNIPPGRFLDSDLLKKLIKVKNKQIVIQDDNGGFHFNGSIRNADTLKQALNDLPDEYSELVVKDLQLVLDIYEGLFDHQSFTGRSGTFFKYEGLGSVYWHMVSKLLLAVKAVYYKAVEKNAHKEVRDRLFEQYYDIRAGLGLNKTPDVFGAFPTDPYSHTPGHAGAQQPGMTGQVKEDIISRWGELGVVVEKGKIKFMPVLLRKEEFLDNPGDFHYYDITGEKKRIKLVKNTLAFTYCQVPVIYKLSDHKMIKIKYGDGNEIIINGNIVDAATTASVFQREGKVTSMHVELIPEMV